MGRKQCSLRRAGRASLEAEIGKNFGTCPGCLLESLPLHWESGYRVARLEESPLARTPTSRSPRLKELPMRTALTSHQAPEAAKRLRVALVEDHEVLGVGVAAILAGVPQIRFTGSYPTVAALLAETSYHAFPEVVLLDLRLADGSDPAQNVVVLQSRNAHVVVYSGCDDPWSVRRACEAGVLSVVRKSEPAVVLVETVLAAGRGELTPSVDWASTLDSDAAFVAERLDEVESQILTLYACGEQADAVGRKVARATSTVNADIGRIRRKFMEAGLDASSRAALLKRAEDAGLVPRLPPTVGNGTPSRASAPHRRPERGQAPR